MCTKQTFLLGLVLVLLVPGATSQGLFPPLFSPVNFAVSETVTATSTCGECGGEGGEEREGETCLVCNNTCPFGDGTPASLDLLATGILQAGVVSIQTCTVEECIIFVMLVFRPYWTKKDQTVPLCTNLMVGLTHL